MSATEPATAPAHGWAGAAHGPVTAVLHGGGPGCHTTSDFAAVMALRPQRRWLWVDLPGYGASATGQPAPQRSVTAAADGLAALLERLGTERVDVLAQSYGGTVALKLAADRPERLGRIVLIGSQPTPAPGGAGPLRTDPGLAVRARTEYYGGDGPSPAKTRALLAELEWYDATRIPEPTVLARYRASTTARALATAHQTPPPHAQGPPPPNRRGPPPLG
ncbi:alpha/beta hydrolase, partial [Streptomyces viridosporus]|uniref:alpha/beta fold hydrolase n=1 Tax=Streptomyces viridosporus TaxID=67581 RepID=UPI00332B3BEC